MARIKVLLLGDHVLVTKNRLLGIMLSGGHMDKYKFGEFIYQKRKALGITQDELGRRLGCTNKAVSKWETGETLPDVLMLEGLAKSLNITIDELLTQRENKVIEKKNIRLNKLLIFFSALLLVLELITVLVFVVIIPNKSIVVNDDNYQDYIVINPLTEFSVNNNVDQEITIITTYKIMNSYTIIDEINLSCYYKIDCYYYNEDGSNSLITFYDRLCEVKLDKDNTFLSQEIKIKPKSTIASFKGLKSIDVKLTKVNCLGNVKNN